MKKILLILSLAFVVAASALAVSCGAKTYSVSFDTDGGDGMSAVKVEEGQEYQLPVPKRTGYSFEGWYLSEDFSGDAVTSLTVTENVTLYAKWEKLSVITLDLNGGTLDAGTTLYLKSGQVIYDFMQAYIPAKSGFEFGAWFDGDAELARNARMPADGITLRAEYKVGYTVELWTQNLALDGYEMTSTVQGSDYVGTTVTPEQTVTGFRQVTHEGEVTQMALTETAADNLFKLYFDREEYTVRFVANYPDGSSAQDYTVQARYGVAVELPYDYSFEGYFLSGWSTSAGGSVDYKLNYIDTLIYNKEGDSLPQADEFVPTRNMALYGVWNKGYTDMFGGGDYIFLFEENARNVYLCRGDVYFKGEYIPESRQFNFIDDTLGQLMVSGRLNEDGTFAYYNESRGYSATLYVVGQGLVENTRIVFDEYNGLTYTVQGEDGYNTNSSGTYSIDENGYYHVTYTQGDLAGQTMVLTVGTIKVDDASRPAFMLRNEEQVALGTLVRFAIADGQVVYYKPEYGGITLNGFETAVMNNGESTVSYRYVMSEDGKRITLLNAYGMEAGVAEIVDFNGTKGYMLYDESYDKTFTGENGGTLVLDGLCNATYTNGTTVETGYYSFVRASMFGGAIVSFSSTDGQKHLFIVKTVTTGSGDEATSVSSYVEKPLGYSEYLYQADGSIYYAPLIVLDDKKEGWASLYGYDTETKTYEFVSEGTYTYDETSELYLFTVVGEPVQTDSAASFVDLTKVKSIVFAVTVTATSDNSIYYVNYWHSAVIETEEGTDAEENYSKVYTCTNVQGGKLTLAGGFAILEQGGNRYTGTYSASSTNANLLAIGVTQNGSVTGYLYVEIDPDAMTYYSLDTAPYTAQALLADGTFSKEETMAFDGKGGAVYTVGDTKYTGTFAANGEETAFGMTIYTFTAEGMQFNFLLLSTSNAVYFAKYNESIGQGIYESEGAGILELDGFGVGASYTAPNGSKVTGMYFLTSDEVSDKVLVLYTQYGYFYIDYKDDSLSSFTVRGSEYGNFLFMDNQNFLDSYVRLDGYGNAAVFKSEGEEIVYVDENGTYTINSDDTVTIRYNSDASTQVTLTGSLRIYTIGSSNVNVFVVQYSEFMRVYVNESDWSVLVLDGYGNVTRYDGAGNAEAGTYTVITDNLLYYANAAGTDASLYTYSNADGTMVPVSITREHAYYTSDLESLLFTKYGFAVFNGETRYYYNLVDGKVVIYLQDPSSADANEYGFVEDTSSFTSFDETIEYGGKTYYANDGFRLTFERDETTADQYPVMVDTGNGQSSKMLLGDLYFTPSGGTEFSVTATIYVGETAFNGTVVREQTEDGYEMYVRLSAANGFSYFRFDITVDYRGSAAGAGTYAVTGMSLINEFPANNYLTMYYLVYLFYGPTTAETFENSMGEIFLITEYDEAGEAGTPYLNFWLGESTGVLGVDGKPFNLEKVSYESLGNNAYSATFTGTDGYEYQLLFTATYNNYVGTYGFQLYGLIRYQDLVDEGTGITVTVGRIVGSEALAAGSLFSVQLTKDGQPIKADWQGYIGEDVYYVARTREEVPEAEEGEEQEEGKILSTTYYKVELVEESSDQVGETNENVIPVYAKVTLTAEAANTYYTADETTYVDITAESNEVRLLVIGSRIYTVTQSAYDDQTKTYTATTASGTVYTITVTDGGVAVVTEVPAAEDEAQA